MAYPSTFLRLVLKWTLPDGEVANTTCSWHPSSPLVSLDDATATALHGRAVAAWAGFKNRYAPAVSFVGTSTLWVNTDGRILARIDKPITAVPGTASGNSLPNEVAAVVSLRTATAGRRTRGRMYWPNPSTIQMDVNGRYIDAFGAGLIAYSAGLLAPLTVGAETFTAVVASATGSVLTPVTAVAVGNVPDAQRRRRDAQLENYQVQTI